MQHDKREKDHKGEKANTRKTVSAKNPSVFFTQPKNSNDKKKITSIK